MINDICQALLLTEASWLKTAVLAGALATGSPAALAKEAPPAAVKQDASSVKELFAKEYDVIRKAALRNDVEEGTEDFYILLAIRKSENGRAGIEFGVLHPRAKNTNLDTQAGWAAATIVKNRARWEKAGKKEDFITFLGRRYCPVGAENDPNSLNKHWISNVTRWTSRLRSMK